MKILATNNFISLKYNTHVRQIRLNWLFCSIINTLSESLSLHVLLSLSNKKIQIRNKMCSF